MSKRGYRGQRRKKKTMPFTPEPDTNGTLEMTGRGRKRDQTMAERAPWEADALRRLRDLNQQEY